MLAMLRELVTWDKQGKSSYSSITVTDDFAAEFASNSYLIQLAYVGLLANSSLGGDEQAEVFVELIYRHNERKAREELDIVWQDDSGAQKQGALSMLPASCVGLDSEGVRRGTNFFQAYAIFGVERLGQNYAQPIIELSLSEGRLEEASRMAFRLAFPSFVTTFDPVVAKQDCRAWQALIRALWPTWHNAWQWLAGRYDTMLQGATLDAEEVRHAPPLPPDPQVVGSGILVALSQLAHEAGPGWQDIDAMATIVKQDRHLCDKGLALMLDRGLVALSRSRNAVRITVRGMRFVQEVLDQTDG